MVVVPALVGVALFNALPLFRTKLLRFPRVGQILLFAIAAFVALWATYLFAVGRIANQNVFAGQQDWEKIPAFIRNARVPMPSFSLGVLYLYGHNKYGHPTYLNGQLGKMGWWYYFPEAIALKEPLALLAAIASGAIFICRADRQTIRCGLAVVIPGALFLLVAMCGHINIGIRHMLPVLPCMYVFACLQLTTSKRGTIALLTLMLIALSETAPYQPDYLPYFNALAGGPRGGERFLIDSNLDWGQDVSRLAKYLHSPAARDRSYTMRFFNERPFQLATEVGLDSNALLAPPHGLFAISKNVRHGLFGFNINRDGSITRPPDYSWLDRCTPIAHAGYSIDIYDLGTAATTAPMNLK